jgi:hypothetical protein
MFRSTMAGAQWRRQVPPAHSFKDGRSGHQFRQIARAGNGATRPAACRFAGCSERPVGPRLDAGAPWNIENGTLPCGFERVLLGG